MKNLLILISIFTMLVLSSCDLIPETNAPTDAETIENQDNNTTITTDDNTVTIEESSDTPDNVTVTIDEDAKDPNVLKEETQETDVTLPTKPVKNDSDSIEEDTMDEEVEQLQDEIGDSDEIMNELLNILENENLAN